MSTESAILFPEIRSYTGMSNSIDDSAIVDPEIRSSMDDDSAILDQEIRGMNSRLYMAAEEGDVSALNKFIEDEYNIFEEFTGLGNSVLHIAISCSKWQFVERVIEEVQKKLEEGREFVRAKNSGGNSALHLAALHGYHQLVAKLVLVMKGEEDVEGGDDFLRCQNREGNTALHQAAKGRYLIRTFKDLCDMFYKDRYYKVMQILLEHNNDLIGLQNNEGETALFLASQNGRTEIVEELLRHRACNSNMKRGDGQTPLHSAVLNGHTDVVEKLLKHRPQLAKETDNCGRTVMHMLALSFSTSRFLGVFHCHRRNTAKIVGQLMAKDNSLSYRQDNNKQTPTHMALELERYELVNILLLCGRDQIEAVDKDGRKPLHLALLNTTRLTRTTNLFVVYQFKSMLFSLISKESVNHCDNTGRTPLHIALQNFEKDAALYQSIINVLQNRGALRTPIILDLMRRVEQSPPSVGIKAENVSINSVLIATISFAAAFTLPGGLDSEQQAVLLNTFLFKVFVICDTLSFCASIASAIIIQFVDKRNQQVVHREVVWTIRIMWLALVSLLFAFGAALHMVITPSPFLAVTVWTMLSFVPLYICFCRSKPLVFLEVSSTISVALAVSLVFVLVFPLFMPYIILSLFLFSGLIYMFLSSRRASQIRLLKSHIDDGR